jgi:hypothetical protein
MSTAEQSVILEAILWCFIGEPFESRAEFEQEVKLYQLEVNGSAEHWQPTEIAIPDPRIRVSFSFTSEDEEQHAVFELRADGPGGFESGELLFKIHNAVVEILCEDPHQYFEGLCFDTSWQKPGRAPLYAIIQGNQG